MSDEQHLSAFFFNYHIQNILLPCQLFLLVKAFKSCFLPLLSSHARKKLFFNNIYSQ